MKHRSLLRTCKYSSLSIMLILIGISPSGWASHSSSFSNFEPACCTDSGWSSSQTTSHSTTAATMAGWTGNFLGTFGNETVSLGVLDALPAGPGEPNFAPRLVTLSFDLVLRGDWYGNFPGYESFFDVWGNTNLLLHTTFDTLGIAEQSFPGNYPDGHFAPGTGSVYSKFWNPETVLGAEEEAGYHIILSFPLFESASSSGTHMSIQFAKSGYEGFSGGATWGLDNVSLNWSEPLPLPVPPALLLFVSGLATLFFAQHRRKKSC